MNYSGKILQTNRAFPLRTARGFTLTELMIVVAIISILAAVGYPSYMDSVRKGNRTEAKTELMALSQSLERCMSLHGSYTHGDCPDFPYTTQPKGLYTIRAVDEDNAATIDENSFTITAIPATNSPQNDDTDCLTISIDNTGDRTPAACWR